MLDLVDMFMSVASILMGGVFGALKHFVDGNLVMNCLEAGVEAAAGKKQKGAESATTFEKWCAKKFENWRLFAIFKKLNVGVFGRFFGRNFY